VLPVAGAPATRAWDLLREPMMRRLMLVNWCLSSCWDRHCSSRFHWAPPLQ